VFSLSISLFVGQFVPFNSRVTQPDALARELLAEIPTQLVSAYVSRGIMPNPPVAGQWVPQTQ
jgi:hypothetical protein